MLTVFCFDTNIYELIVDENKRLRPEYQSRKDVSSKLSKLISKGSIIPVLSESIFIDELFKRNDREEIKNNYKPNVNCVISKPCFHSNSIQMNIQISQDSNHQPTFENNPEAKKYYDAAIKMGFKIIRCPSWIGGRSNLQLEPNDFLFNNIPYNEESEKMHAALDIINKLVEPDKYKQDFSENTDRESIASCYGYNINYFCTDDKAKSTGPSSIMHPKHKIFLEKKLKITIISPEEAVLIIENILQKVFT